MHICIIYQPLDHTKNIILYASLTGLGVIGVSVFIFIRRNKNPEEPAIEVNTEMVELPSVSPAEGTYVCMSLVLYVCTEELG